jgi:hypothetical protein
MNESCVPKCFNLWKTYQDLSLSLSSKKRLGFRVYLIMDKRIVFCQQIRFTDLIFGEPTTYPFSLQERKFPLPPGASPDLVVVVTFCRARQARARVGGHGKSVLWITM